MSELWNRKPLSFVDGIPVFSESDRYIDNYKQIASDHVQSMRPGAANPWIPDDLWLETEGSTVGLLRRHVRSGQSILDVGVGLGRILGHFPELERYGVDISLDYLKVARDKGIDVAFSRIEDLPYNSESFDVVVCCDVLEHAFDLHRCCSEILRVLKPGGTLVVRVPNDDALDPYVEMDLPYEYIHVRRFDLAELRLLFTKIFPCIYVEALPVAYYLKGAPRLKLRPLPGNAQAVALAAEAEDPSHPLHLLKRASAVSMEEFINWIYALRDNHREIFDQIAPDLVTPLEINVVVRKPPSA